MPFRAARCSRLLPSFTLPARPPCPCQVSFRQSSAPHFALRVVPILFLLAGGHGDFSVILGERREYFSFFFSNYDGGPQEGLAVARMPYAARARPVGQVVKYFAGHWSEPGLGGRVTPVIPAAISRAAVHADASWGPSVHFNTHLLHYVLLMTRSCRQPGWPPADIYVSFSPDLTNPASWISPALLRDQPGWYSQVFGSEAGESDSRAGRTARLYLGSDSRWPVEFFPGRAPEAVAAGTPTAAGSGALRCRASAPSLDEINRYSRGLLRPADEKIGQLWAAAGAAAREDGIAAARAALAAKWRLWSRCP